MAEKQRLACFSLSKTNRWLPAQMRISYLAKEVVEGQRRMWIIKGKIKAAYKYNKQEFHRVSATGGSTQPASKAVRGKSYLHRENIAIALSLKGLRGTGQGRQDQNRREIRNVLGACSQERAPLTRQLYCLGKHDQLCRDRVHVGTSRVATSTHPKSFEVFSLPSLRSKSKT